MRVVDPKDLDAVVNPVPHHAQHLVVEPGGIVVEVDRIDVLVLLRRVLRVGDGAVRQLGEPLPVVAGPRMVRRALQRQVQRHLHARLSRRGDEVVEVVDRAQLGMDGVVAALVAADRPRRSDVAGRGGRGVVAALAVHLADRVDRRQVHHVEPHLGDARQRRRGGGEGAVHRVAVGVPAAGRTRKHLVPGAEAGQRPVHPDAVLLAAGDQFAQRILRQQFVDLGRQRQRRAGHRVAGVRSAAAASSSGWRCWRGTPVAARSNSAAPTSRSLDSSVSPWPASSLATSP